MTLKTVAQWKRWEDHRSVFNRFLIGNALVVALAFLCLAPKVSLDIKLGDQDAEQTADCPESKFDGSDKPQPESEARSR